MSANYSNTNSNDNQKTPIKDNFAFVEPLPASLLHERMPEVNNSSDSSDEESFIQSTNSKIKFPKNQNGSKPSVLQKSNIPVRVRPRANTNVSMSSIHTRHKSNDDEMLEIARVGHKDYDSYYNDFKDENYARELEQDDQINKDAKFNRVNDRDYNDNNNDGNDQKKNNPASTNRANGARSYSSVGHYQQSSNVNKARAGPGPSSSRGNKRTRNTKRQVTKGRRSEPHRPQNINDDDYYDNGLNSWSIPPPTSNSLPPGKNWDDVIVPTLARKIEKEKMQEDEWNSSFNLHDKGELIEMKDMNQSQHYKYDKNNNNDKFEQRLSPNPNMSIEVNNKKDNIQQRPISSTNTNVIESNNNENENSNRNSNILTSPKQQPQPMLYQYQQSQLQNQPYQTTTPPPIQSNSRPKQSKKKRGKCCTIM